MLAVDDQTTYENVEVLRFHYFAYTRIEEKNLTEVQYVSETSNVSRVCIFITLYDTIQHNATRPPKNDKLDSVPSTSVKNHPTCFAFSSNMKRKRRNDSSLCKFVCLFVCFNDSVSIYFALRV